MDPMQPSGDDLDTAEPSVFETPPSASLNRVRIMDLPGLALDPQVRGKRSDELVSSRALIAYASTHAPALGLRGDNLDGEMPLLTRSDVALRVNMPQIINAALADQEGARRAAAQCIVQRLGRNLGWLLITLHRGDAANRAVRPDWQSADWEKWHAVRRIWLGGGLASDRLGNGVLGSAQSLLAQLGYHHLELNLSPYGGLLPLIGAARAVEETHTDGESASLMAFDFGHTLVKRAVLRYYHGVLVAVEQLTPVIVDWDCIYPDQPDEVILGRRVLDFMAETIAQGIGDVSLSFPTVQVSVGAYKQQGRLVSNGPYASIHAGRAGALADDLLTAALSRRLSYSPNVRLVHDGTAAGLAHAGSPNGAVIVMGTALGIGFPPASDTGLRGLAPGLEVT